MRYIELLTLIFLLIGFSIFFSKGISIYSKLDKANREIEFEYNSYDFISKSFKNTCEGYGFNSLYEWQRKCKTLWNLDYIGWCDCHDFLPSNNLENRKILYGKWIGKNIEGEVYWEKINE